MEENLLVKIKVENSEAVQRANQLKQSLIGVSSSTTQAQSSINTLKNSLMSLAPASMGVVSQFSTFANTLAQVFNATAMASNKQNYEAMIAKIKEYDKHIDKLCKTIDKFDKQGKDTSGLEKQIGGLEELKESAEEASKGYSKALDDMINKAKKFGVKAGLIFGAILLEIKALKALVKMTNEISAISAEIDDMAQKVQMSNSQYQQWSYIMQMCGSDMNDLQTAMNGMLQRLKSADGGSESALQGFQKLGINVYDASGKLRDSFDIFQEAIYKLQGLAEGSERAVIANQIFGKSSSNLAILLNTSSEQMEYFTRAQEALGLSMSENQIRLSASYQDALDTMKLAGQSFKGVISELILPPLTAIVKAIIKTITYMKIFIAGLFGIKDSSPATNDVSSNIGSIGTNAENASGAVNKLKRSLMGFDELNVLSSPVDTSGLGGFDLDLGELELGSFKDEFDALFNEEEFQKIEKFRNFMTNWGERIKLIFSGLYKYILGINTHNDILKREGLNEILQGITGKTLPEFLAECKKKIEDWLTNEPPTWLNTIIEICKGIYNIIVGAMNGDLGQIVQGCAQIKNAIKNSKIEEEANNIANSTEKELSGSIERTRRTWAECWDDMKKKISNAWQELKNFIGSTDDIQGYTFTGGFKASEIKMATGGIVEKPTRALIGEAGREAVLPLENNTGWMDTLANHIIGKQNTPSKIVLEVDGRELGYATINNINSITKSTGKLALIV